MEIDDSKIFVDDFYLKWLNRLGFNNSDFSYKNIKSWLSERNLKIVYNDETKNYELYNYNNLAKKDESPCRTRKEFSSKYISDSDPQRTIIKDAISLVINNEKFNLDKEILDVLELTSQNIKIEICLMHNHFFDEKTTSEINISNLATGMGDCVIYNNYHPGYLLSNWNKTKNKRLKKVRMMDEFINKTLNRYLKKIEENNELKKSFYEFKNESIKKTKFKKGQKVICIRNMPWQYNTDGPKYLEILNIAHTDFLGDDDVIKFDKYSNYLFKSHNFKAWNNQKKYIKLINQM